MECTHLLDNVNENIFNVEDKTISKNFNCSECSVDYQNWLCLQCGVVNCGRYLNGHAKLHAEAMDHQLCMSCENYSVHCYKCENYVSNDLEYNPIDKIKQSISQLQRQHDVETNGSNGNLEQSENNSEDWRWGRNSLGSSASVSDKQASPSGSGDESRSAQVISRVLFGDGPNIPPETGESKTSKSIKLPINRSSSSTSRTTPTLSRNREASNQATFNAQRMSSLLKADAHAEKEHALNINILQENYKQAKLKTAQEEMKLEILKIQLRRLQN